MSELSEYLADERSKPQQCRECGNWCMYDGWEWVHAWGVGINSCNGSIRKLS